jgi:hypothetical protein
MANVLANKQRRYDVESNKAEILQDQMSQLQGIGETDLGIIRAQGQKMNEIAQQYSNKDLADSRIAKEFRSQMKTIANDPLLRSTQTSLASVQKYQEDLQDLKSKGTYREENDPFAQQYRAYTQGEGAKAGSLKYFGIIEGVEERPVAETFVDNVPESGFHKFIQMGKTIKKVGSEGITEAQMSGVVQNSIGAFANTSAGQQALRRLRLEQSRGMNVNVRPEQYLASILASAAQERVGVTTVSGDLSGIIGAGDGIGGREQTSVPYVTSQQKKLADAEFEFDATGSLEGSGTSSFVDYFTNVFTGKENKKSFWDIMTDTTMTTEEKEVSLPVYIKAKINGVTEKQAYESLDVEIAPKWQGWKKTADKNLAEAQFSRKGAGYFSGRMVYNQDGEKVTGKELFESLGLTDSDGLFDPDVAATIGVNVLGPHILGTGVIADGIHVNIAGVNYIFEDPDPSTEATEALFTSQAQATGVAQNPVDGQWYARDPKTGKFGRWDAKKETLVFK